MEMNTVTVYDIQNKFIAYSAPFPAVIGVFCEWGSLYVLAGDKKVCTLKLTVYVIGHLKTITQSVDMKWNK